jgi:hypothetical protein
MNVVINNMSFEYCAVSPLTMGHRKIKSLSKLSDGWNYGEGTKFSSKRITDAEKIDNLLVQLFASPTDAFPGLGGQIMVTAYKDDFYIEYTLHDDHNFSVRANKAGTTICGANYVDQAKALSKLAWLAGQIWNTSGSSTQGSTTIGIVIESTGSRLAVLPMGALQSSTVNALTQHGAIGAPT